MVCGSEDTRVIDSRSAEHGKAIRRRRECEGCQHRFTTFERYVDPSAPIALMVIKRSGGAEAFDRTKITAGVTAATKGRPVESMQIDRLADEIEDLVRAEGGSIRSDAVGLAVLDRLRDLDHVAYLRFASVYKGFDEVGDFVRELALLDTDS